MAGPVHKGHLGQDDLWLDDWLTAPSPGVALSDPFAAMGALFDAPIQQHHVSLPALPSVVCMDTISASNNAVAVSPDIISASPDAMIVLGGEITNTVTATNSAAVAMGANTARSDFNVNGSGITIGILSNSFNVDNGMSADIAAGNLPAANMIDIIQDGTTGDDDEGRAMAQLIHQVAPGASIDFYSAEGGDAAFATGIGSLIAAGCNIIVDDVTYTDEPFFQDGNVIQTAAENAINKGVSYFTSAGNEANGFYQQDWIANTFTVPTFGKQTAFDFGIANGGTSSPYETFTVNKGYTANLELQWDQPFESISGTGSADALRLELFQNGSLLFSQSSTLGADPSIGIQIANTGTAAATYQIAIALIGGTTAPGMIKMIDFDDAGTSGGGFVGGAGVGSGTVTGHELVPGANTVGAVNWANTPAQGGTLTLEPFSSVGSGEFLFNAEGTRLASPEMLHKVNFTAPDGSTTSVFNPFLGTSAAAPDAAAVAALMLQANPALTPALITSDLESTALSMNGGTNAVGAGFIQAVPAVQLAVNQAEENACYLAGTRILTPGGPMLIERLAIGDPVITQSGTLPVRWIGWRRIDLARHPSPAQARPICIRRGAFADNLPQRDLRVSPEHALFIDDVLIPAALLVNGSSIVQDQTLRHVHYLHLELPRHAVLFAEGLPAESWLDTGNRYMFDNATELSSDRSAEAAWEHDACAPLVNDPHRVRFVWQRLAERARTLPLPPLVSDPDLQLSIGETIVRPVRESTDRYVFVLPPRSGLARLRSRILSPTAEERMLGVCIKRIVSHGANGAIELPLDADALQAGWWDVERDAASRWRWTDGDAALALPFGAEFLEVHLTGSLRYALSDAMKAAA